MLKRILFIVVALGVTLPLFARSITAFGAQGRIFTTPEAVPAHRVAIVFGAGVRNGQPSTVLRDRIASGVELYRAGKVNKLLMSGDNRYEDYNEPGAMRRTALEMGVPDGDIAMDYAGRSTYDTCYRAREIFGVQAAVLVTQDYHLDRAVMTCSALGVQAVGYTADQRAYRGMSWFQIRELGATLNAVIELFITRPLPVLGEKVVIE